MCESVENYAREYAKEYAQEELIANVLRMKDKLDVKDISEFLSVSEEKVNQIISLNSADIEYIYNQIK